MRLGVLAALSAVRPYPGSTFGLGHGKSLESQHLVTGATDQIVRAIDDAESALSLARWSSSPGRSWSICSWRGANTVGFPEAVLAAQPRLLV